MSGKVIDAGSSGEWGWHATELALRCPQLFSYTYRLKVLNNNDKEPLLRGSLVHAGLAQHYRRRQAIECEQDPNEWATPEDGVYETAKKLGPEASKYVDQSLRILNGYFAHYVTENLVVEFVEEVFSAEIDGYKFTQRLDLIVREADGKVYIWDHKCVGRIDQKTVTRYTLSGQFLGMAMFGRQSFGNDFGGVKLNLLAVDGTFKRVLVDPAPHALNTFPISVAYARQLVSELDKAKVPYDHWPKTLSEQCCVTSYGVCDAFDLCRWGVK